MDIIFNGERSNFISTNLFKVSSSGSRHSSLLEFLFVLQSHVWLYFFLASIFEGWDCFYSFKILFFLRGTWSSLCCNCSLQRGDLKSYCFFHIYKHTMWDVRTLHLRVKQARNKHSEKYAVCPEVFINLEFSNYRAHEILFSSWDFSGYCKNYTPKRRKVRNTFSAITMY